MWSYDKKTVYLMNIVMDLERLFLRIVITLFSFYGLITVGILVCYYVGLKLDSFNFLIFSLAFIISIMIEKQILDKNLRMSLIDWIYFLSFFLFLIVVGIIVSNSY